MSWRNAGANLPQGITFFVVDVSMIEKQGGFNFGLPEPFILSTLMIE